METWKHESIGSLSLPTFEMVSQRRHRHLPFLCRSVLLQLLSELRLNWLQRVQQCQGRTNLQRKFFRQKKLKLCEKKIHKKQRCIPSITESQASRRSCKHSCKHEWISAILRKHAPNIHRSLYKVDGTFANVDIWWHYHHGLSDSALVKFFHWIQQTERVAPNNWPNMANIAGKKKAWLCLCIDGVSRLTSTLSRMGCVILATVWVVTRLSKEQTKSKNVHL